MPTVNPRMGYSGARAKDNSVCLIERTSMYIQLSFSIDLKRSSSKFSKKLCSFFFLFSWETIFPTTVTIHILIFLWAVLNCQVMVVNKRALSRTLGVRVVLGQCLTQVECSVFKAEYSWSFISGGKQAAACKEWLSEAFAYGLPHMKHLRLRRISIVYIIKE